MCVCEKPKEKERMYVFVYTSHLGIWCQSIASGQHDDDDDGDDGDDDDDGMFIVCRQMSLTCCN